MGSTVHVCVECDEPVADNDPNCIIIWPRSRGARYYHEGCARLGCGKCRNANASPWCRTCEERMRGN